MLLDSYAGHAGYKPSALTLATAVRTVGSLYINSEFTVKNANNDKNMNFSVEQFDVSGLYKGDGEGNSKET